MSSVEEICDEISLINQSKVVLEGDVDEIRRRYAKGIFRVDADIPAEELPIAQCYELLSSEYKNDRFNFSLQKKKGVSNRELLSELTGQFNLHAFKEEIPSMNDIFIQTVQPWAKSAWL